MKLDDIARASRVDRFVRVVTLIESSAQALNHSIADTYAALLNEGFFISTVSFGYQIDVNNRVFTATMLANRRCVE